MAKINWYNGKTANSASDMQKLCDAINRSLSVPEIAPADTKVVAVDNTNTQKMLTIGDGLSIENDTLKASVSGGKLYEHFITLNTPHINFNTSFYIISKSDIPLSNETLLGSYLKDRGFELNKAYMYVSSNDFSSTEFKSKARICYDSSNNGTTLVYDIRTLKINTDNTIGIERGGSSAQSLNSNSAGATTFTDIVKEI